MSAILVPSCVIASVCVRSARKKKSKRTWNVEDASVSRVVSSEEIGLGYGLPGQRPGAFNGPYPASFERTPTRPARIGILGCGPIAQHAHLDSVRKAANAELHAICDVAEDLVSRIAEIHRPARTFLDYGEMLADPELDGVVIAASDQFHVPLALKAVEAGKHVLVEKPLGVTIEECEQLAAAAQRARVCLHVGFMKRYDPGITYAKRFIETELGELIQVKAWYCDSAFRYWMTNNLLPVPVESRSARKPATDPKADRRRYLMLAHGSHLVDFARYIGGDIEAIEATLVERSGVFSWASTVHFTAGAVGQLDLTIPVAMDWHEGFTIYGERGGVLAKSYLPWHQRATEVECFSAERAMAFRPLSPDAHFYKLQVEGFAAAVLGEASPNAATVDDGIAAMRAMVATAWSAQRGSRIKLDEVSGGL